MEMLQVHATAARLFFYAGGLSPACPLLRTAYNSLNV